MCVCVCVCTVFITRCCRLLSIQFCQRASIHLATVYLDNERKFMKLSSEIHYCLWMETLLTICWNNPFGYRLWKPNECAYSWISFLFVCFVFSITSIFIGHGNKGEFIKVLIISKCAWSLKLRHAYWHLF